MEPRKTHISPQLLLGLTALLVAGCLMVAVGVSFARYRTETKDGIIFHPYESGQIFLGCMEENGFVCQQSTWQTGEEQLQLPFAISNGADPDSCSTADQQARICLLVSLGAWQEQSGDSVSLTVDGTVYTGVAQRITEGSTLHTQFGDGWAFRFVDEAGNEPVWELPGGQFTCIEMLLQVDSSAILDIGLMQLQVIAEN